ncbi:MAG: MFS transporter [Chloroflexi bacterium]|nr:MFS transporter [Chloroflexota bacterium]
MTRKTNRLALWRAQANYYHSRFNARLSAWLHRQRGPEEMNALHLYGDIAWFGVTNAILGTFTSAFAIRLGASDTLVGLLSSLPALINIFWQVPSGRVVQRSGQIRRVTFWSLLAQRLAYLLIAIMPFFLLRYRAEAVVGLITLASLPGALGGVAFTTLMAKAVSPEKRAGVVSIRNMLLSLTGMLSVLLAGKLLDTIPVPYNYQLFFGVAFLTSMFSLYNVSKVHPLPELEAPKPAATPTSAPVARVPLRTRLRDTWQTIRSQREFYNFAVGNFLYGWAMYFPMALYGLYRVRDLQASNSWLGLISTVGSATQIVMFLLWGRIMKRRGNRWVFLVSAFGLAGFPFLTGLFTRIEPLVWVSVWSGIFNASWSISNFDCLISSIPSNRVPTFMAIYNTLLNVTAFIAPLLGTAVAGWIGARYALMLAGGMRLAGALVLSRLPFGYTPPRGTAPSLLERLRSLRQKE